MHTIFLTHAGVISPRWRQAFPRAEIIECIEALPPNLSNSLLWALALDAKLLGDVPRWIAAGARVVILTKLENPQEAKLALEQGANGYCHYLAAVPVLKQVSQVVQVGGLWLGADLMRQLVFATATVVNANVVNVRDALSLLDVLTVRENSVAQAVAAGKTNKEIARDLNITERTVKAHLSAVFEKLNVRDRLHLVLVMAEKYKS